MRTQYERDGFVVVNNILSPDEVTQLREEIRNVLEATDVNGDPARVAEVENFQKHGVFLGLAAASPLFRNLARNETVVNVLRDIIGPHIIFLNDKVVYKNADTDFGSPWHQDYPYWNGSHKVSAWIALDDVTTDNGCLKVIPGSHRHGVLDHHGKSDDGLGFGNRLTGDLFDENAAVPVEMTAGSIVFFGDLLLHASYPNTSGRDRWALISTYKDGEQEDPAYSWAPAAFTVLQP